MSTHAFTNREYWPINGTVAALLFCFIVGCADKTAAPPKRNDPPIVESFHLEDGFPIILPVHLGDNEYRFIFDTGCSASSFNLKHKDKLGKYIESQTSTGALWQKIPIDFYEVTETDRFQLGKIRLIGKVGLMDYSYFGDWVNNRDGLLGVDILGRFIIQLDFRKNRLLLLKPDTKAKADWGEAFDLTFSGGTPHLQVQLTENISESFMIDTASPMVFLTQDKFEQLFYELRPDAEYKKRPITRQTNSLNQIRLRDFSLGGTVYESFPVTEHARSFLGMDFLTMHSLVTLDFPGKKIYLKK